MRESGDLINEAQAIVRQDVLSLLKGPDAVTEKKLKDTVTNAIQPYLYEKTKRRPMIVPVIMGV